MTSRTRYAEFSGDAADLRLMLEKAKTSATRKDEHGLARMVFEGVDLTPDDAAQMKRIKARVAIEETIRVMMEKGADDEAIEKATLAIDAKTKVGADTSLFRTLRAPRGKPRCQSRSRSAPRRSLCRPG